MDRSQAIETVRLRKQALLVESHLNRLAFDAEWQNVRAAASWAREIAQTGRTLRPWLLLAAPLVGLLPGRGGLGSTGRLGRLLGLLRWVRPLLTVWGALGETKRAHER
jgi:hypothetical protein